MSSNLIKLKKLIFHSDLKDADKENLIALFSQAKDKDLKIVVDLFRKDPRYIKIINNVFKAKRKAFQKKDKILWQMILVEEYKSLKNLAI